MIPRDPLWRSALIATAVLLVGLLFLAQALAQEMPPRMHNPDNPDHWYALECCDLRHCQPASETGVIEGPDGYVIRELGLTIPYNSKKIRNSKDGRFHPCYNRSPKANGIPFYCLYVPPRAF